MGEPPSCEIFGWILFSFLEQYGPGGCRTRNRSSSQIIRFLIIVHWLKFARSIPCFALVIWLSRGLMLLFFLVWMLSDDNNYMNLYRVELTIYVNSKSLFYPSLNFRSSYFITPAVIMSGKFSRSMQTGLFHSRL